MDKTQVEEWLETHPEFATEYFSKNATQPMVNAWMDKHHKTTSHSYENLQSMVSTAVL